ncbi:MAG: ABC transporter substrate-binding protein [Sphaerochaetaceae bacterium]
MKKFAILCLLFILVTTMVFAQGDKGAVAPVAEKTKLTIWGRDIPDTSADHMYVKSLIEGFQAANPDIELEYIALGDPGLADKTKIAMVANQIPEIIQSWGGSVMGGYADAGRLLDLTAEMATIPGSDAARNAMSWKGKTYGVAPFFAIAGIFANEGIFKAQGLTVPTTVSEMEKVCDALLAKGIIPFACGAKDKWPPLAMYMYLVNRVGGNAFDKAQARTLGFDSTAFIEAAKIYQKWVEKGYFGPKPLGEAYGDAQQLMATGKAAMHVTGSWMCAQYANKEFTDQTIGFYAFPVISGGVGQTTDVMGMTDIGFFATQTAASKKEAVLRFFRYAMSVEACGADPGRICSVPGVKAPSALTGMASAVFSKAKTVQFWWDQDLAPAVTSPLNDTIQTFFLPKADVKAELVKFEALVAENMGVIKK